MPNPINPVKNTRESYDRFYQKNITEVLVQFGNENPAWIPYDTLIPCKITKTKMTSSIVLVTGGFDPIHSGHIAYFKSAKAIAPLSPLAVGLNSDQWLTNKKGKPFMPIDERISIVRELKMVDVVIEYDDSDGTSNRAIEQY